MRLELLPRLAQLGLLYLATVECTVSNRATEPMEESGASTSAAGRAELSAPAFTTELPLAIPANATHLRIDLVSVQNPTATAFELIPSLLWSAGGANEQALTPASPYPPTDTQSLLVALPTALRASLQGKRSARARLVLAPVSAAAPLPDTLRVIATAQLITL